MRKGSGASFKDKLVLILHNLFQIIEEERRLSNLLHDASISLISKPNKDSTKKTKQQIYRPIFLLNIDTKILTIILENQF